MAHIPMDDIKQIWRELSDRSWKGLGEYLREHKGKADGISDTLVDEMGQVASEMEKSEQGFPGSADDLYKMINEKTKSMP